MIKIKLTFFSIIIGLLSFFTAAQNASASLIAVFPDVNLFQGALTAGEQTMATNLLGGGNEVLISQQGGLVLNTNLNPFYNSIGGVTSSVTNAELTGGGIGSADLLFLDLGYQHDNPYSVSEISAINSFFGTGGNLGIIAEPRSGSLVSVNNLLAALGVGISLDSLVCCGGIHSADTVLDTALTTAGSDITFGASHTLSGGTAAVQDQGYTVVAYVGETQQVPEPATLALFGIGLAGLGFARKKKKAA